MYILPLLLIVAATLGLGLWQLRRRSLHRWLGAYLRQSPRRWASHGQHPIHLLLCIADHYEPDNGGASPETAQARVDCWIRDYPRLFAQFRDSDGRPPRHTFFYPIETYNADHLDALASLCRQDFGEIEIHLHHDADTPQSLQYRLETGVRLLAHRHGMLARHRQTGSLAYAFVHGNWALANSRPDGRWCGVDNELEILRQTGCYADFTFPSAPDCTQPRKINSIYYAPTTGRCAHESGDDVGQVLQPPNSLLLIQGPLLLDWQHRKRGLIPHIENACIQGNQPPTDHRINLWLKARIQVPTRPDWFFVKLHPHGSPELNQCILLGSPMVEFHNALARRAQQDANFHFHYVTAR
ncbi:MAG TPA: hypothetical protein VHP11_06515, partial [Tepidisphaeraceae bacterium]|nr:hypothetical protein [Tepidisphaeraceae bacterium]